MGGRHRSARSARHHHHSPYHHPAHQHHHAASNALVNPVFRDPFAGFGMSPFGLLGGPLMGFGGGPHRSIFDEFDDGMQMHHPGMQMHPAAVGGGFTSVQTFSGSMGGLNGGVGMRSSSTSTRFVNGKKITTKRYAIRFFFLFVFVFFFFFLHKKLFGYRPFLSYVVFFFSELSIMASRQSRHMKTMSWKVILWMDKSRPLVQQIMPKLYEIITDCSKCHMNWNYCKTRYMLQKRCLKLNFSTDFAVKVCEYFPSIFETEDSIWWMTDSFYKDSFLK